MSDRLYFRLAHPAARANAIKAIQQAPDMWRVEIKPPTRSLDQNAALWPRLDALSRQLPWDGEHLTPDEWKDLLIACLRKQKVVRGIEGGLVFLGARSSRMDKEEFSDLLDFIDAFAAQRGIDLREREVA